jgi:hypothetical protein
MNGLCERGQVKFAWSVLLLAVCVGCSTPASRTAHYPVPSYPEPGEIAGQQRIVSPMNGVEEGVYYFNAGLSKLVLELRNGRFRYWYLTDLKIGPEPKYPVAGKYLVRGATVQLLHAELDLQDVWTFRKIDDVTTLWRPDAIKSWHEKRGFDGYGILYVTEHNAEEIWMKPDLKFQP